MRSRELEAAAAARLLSVGVQLIGTAHGNSLKNLLLNPTLADLLAASTRSPYPTKKHAGGDPEDCLERRLHPHSMF